MCCLVQYSTHFWSVVKRVIYAGQVSRFWIFWLGQSKLSIVQCHKNSIPPSVYIAISKDSIIKQTDKHKMTKSPGPDDIILEHCRSARVSLATRCCGIEGLIRQGRNTKGPISQSLGNSPKWKPYQPGDTSSHFHSWCSHGFGNPQPGDSIITKRKAPIR